METERYQITSLLGKGRTGGVYLAEDIILKRTVAIRRFFNLRGETSATTWKTEFLTIAQTLCNLHTPSLLSILDAGIDEDGAFLVSQHIEGTRLIDHITKTPLSQDEAYYLTTQLLEALSLAHRSHLIHGSLSARSVHKVSHHKNESRFILMDLGLARLAPLIQGKSSYLTHSADLHLQAPELFENSTPSPATDCYMLGHVLYMSLAGSHPFAHLDFTSAKQAHKNQTLPSLAQKRPDLDHAFIKWIETLTQPDIKKRVQNTQEALNSLPLKSNLIQKNITSTKNPFIFRPPKPQSQKSTPPLTHTVQSATSTSHPPKNTTPLLWILITVTTLSLIIALSIKNSEKAPTIHLTTPQDTPTQNQLNNKPTSTKKLPPATFKHLRAPITDPIKQSRIGCNLSREALLEWTVFRYPNHDSIHSPKHACIGSPTPLGTLQAFPNKQQSLVFYETNGTRYHPTLSGKCIHAGDGWEIPIHLASFKEDTITLTFHFNTIAINAQIILSAQFSDGTHQTLISKNYINEALYNSYAVTTTIQLTNTTTSLSLKCLALGTIKPQSALSIHALTLE